MSKVELISHHLISKTLDKAHLSQRKRMNHNFHELSENYQRFLNVLLKGTYVRPHRHSIPPKAETFLILKGEIAFLLFNEEGEIERQEMLSSGGPNYGIDIGPGIWHSLVCLSEEAICFEGKTGPYDPTVDKEFATWAPEEGSVEAEAYLFRLEEKVRYENTD